MKDFRHLVESFLNGVEDKKLSVNFIKITQKGETVAEYSRIQKCRLPSWSLAKGFTALGIGLAVDEGLLNLDEKIIDFFPEYEEYAIAQNIKRITLKHLLTMTSGLSNPIFFESPTSRKTKDWAKCFFSDSFPYIPGEKWLYSNFNTYMASRALEKRAHMTLLDYMKPRFFDRIGIFNPVWSTCPMGHTAAANGLMLDIDELAIYTDLLSGFGRTNGNRIVSEEYMKLASSPLVDNSVLTTEKNKTYTGFGYGLQFLNNPGDGYRSEGKYGQFAICLPEKEIGISVMSLDDRSYDIGTLLFEEIVAPLQN